MVFWFCVASAALSLAFVPFLTIGTQGHSKGSSVASLEVDRSDGGGEMEKGVREVIGAGREEKRKT